MKTVSIYFEVRDTDDAIRLINAIDQVIIGELKGFNVYEADEFNRCTYDSVLAERQLNEVNFKTNNKDLSSRVLEAEIQARKIRESKGVNK